MVHISFLLHLPSCIPFFFFFFFRLFLSKLHQSNGAGWKNRRAERRWWTSRQSFSHSSVAPLISCFAPLHAPFCPFPCLSSYQSTTNLSVNQAASHTQIPYRSKYAQFQWSSGVKGRKKTNHSSSNKHSSPDDPISPSFLKLNFTFHYCMLHIQRYSRILRSKTVLSSNSGASHYHFNPQIREKIIKFNIS